MKTYVGFIFTKGPIEDLKRRGFSFHTDDSNLDLGYKSFIIAFQNSNTVEFREIIDESRYVKAFQIEHFKPFLSKPEKQWDPLNHLNGTTEVIDVLFKDQLEVGDLKSFFEIRKPYPLCGIHLKCDDFEKFCRVSDPDHFFEYRNQKLALIHLGPQCFDIVV